MKHLHILFILSSFFVPAKAQKSTEDLSKIIIGEWDISATKQTVNEKVKGKEVSREIITTCNACPKIFFSSNQNAVIKNSTKTNEVYLWRITESKITFVNVGAERLQTESFSGSYNIKANKGNEFLEFELINTSGSIILRKALNK